jgi:hypothetical protein
MDYLSGLICWGYDPSRMADSIGAVIGMKGEERSRRSLAGLKPSRYNVRVGEISVRLGKSLRAKRRP